MKQNSASITIWLIAIPLLIFTAFRSVHLVQSTLPADAHILAYSALAGLDLGLLAWLYYSTAGARGQQKIVANLMICVDMAGICAATIGDTLLIGNPESAAGFVAPVALWIVPIIIVANVGATVAVHLVDPEQKIKDMERGLQDELSARVVEYLQQNSSTIAAQAVPEAAQHRAKQLVEGFLTSSRQASPSPLFGNVLSGLQSISVQKPSGNGQHYEMAPSDTQPIIVPVKKE